MPIIFQHCFSFKKYLPHTELNKTAHSRATMARWQLQSELRLRRSTWRRVAISCSLCLCRHCSRPLAAQLLRFVSAGWAGSQQSPVRALLPWHQPPIILPPAAARPRPCSPSPNSHRGTMSTSGGHRNDANTVTTAADTKLLSVEGHW